MSAIAAPMAGILAAAASVATGHLAAGAVSPAASPILAVGSTVVDLAPPAVKAFAIDTFGENDKTALLIGIAVVLIVAAAAVGWAARRRLVIGIVAIAALGAVGAAAALARPTGRPIDVIPAIVGAIAGAVALTALIRAIGPERDSTAPTTSPADRSRRRFLVRAAAVAAFAGVAGGLGAVLAAARSAAVRLITVPVPTDPAPRLPPGASLEVPGISSFMTANRDFYRVDTALEIPVVDPDTWKLRIHGSVERETVLTFADLVQLPTIERDITLTCVSNVVGGPYAGTARWIGVPLKTVLDIAGPLPGADQIVSRSVDGMTIGTPSAVALDGRDAMLAVAMNGEPLPPVHGAPVRMIVPGLYGYVSATKWLVDLELTTFAAYDPYWVARGWAREGPIKTMSRIDTPRSLATVPAGPITIGGVAWAQHRGIASVHVRIDDGPWQATTLSTVASIDTWRQWRLDWQATPGRHRIEVRATDSDQVIQTDTRREPFPDGATGWHSIVMTVA